MHSAQRLRAVLVLLATPFGLAQGEASCLASAADSVCGAATAVGKEQVLLQGRTALHMARIEDEDFWKDSKKHDVEARRRHLNAVFELASDIVRHGAGAEDLLAAGKQIEAIDKNVLPEIMAEHKQASLLLELQWDAYKVAESFVDQEAEDVHGYSSHAQMMDEAHLNCCVKEGAFQKALDKCEKERQTLEDAAALERSVLDSALAEEGRLGEQEAKLGAVGNHDDVQRQRSKMEARVAKAREQSNHAQHFRLTKGNQCSLWRTQLTVQHEQCVSDQRSSEQAWCLVQDAALGFRGRVADGYAMALSQYESAMSRAQMEEAARKAEFSTVEVVRCLKEHFLASEEGSVADPAWLRQCEEAANETSGLDLSYFESHTTAVRAVTIAPADMPCSLEFLGARASTLPAEVTAAPCTPCKIPSKASTGGHPGNAGHSDKFWIGFHKGVHAATGKDEGHSSHVEHFHRMFAEEGANNSLARFQTTFTQKVLDRLPVEWDVILDQDLHYGFMNGMEVGIDLDVREAQKRRQVEEVEESQEKVAVYLAQAAEAFEKAKEKVEAVVPKNAGVAVSAGFVKASEASKVLPLGETWLG